MPSTTFTMSCSSPTLSAAITLSYKSLGELARLELTGAQTYDVDLAFLPAAG